jgi:hypothetical protein
MSYVGRSDTETQPVLQGLGLEVKLVDAATGRGVFCTRPFEQGDLILSEPPILVCQCFECPVPACRNCLRVLLRDAECVECTGGCGHIYCSESCRQAAAVRYHISMCSAKATDGAHPLVEFEAFVKERANEYYLLAAMALSMSFANLSTLKSSTDLDEFFSARTKLLFGAFAQAPW